MSKWLKCTVSKGMFSDEVTVLVHTRSGEAISVFVPRSFASKELNQVKVRATQNEGQFFAVLPNDNQTVVDVNPVDLLPA